MNKNIINKVAGWSVAACALLAAGACSDTWDNHYDANSGSVTDKTLWQQIKADNSLSDFASVLQKAGYDKKLDADRMYTVWAPLNGTFDAESIKEKLAGENAEQAITEFVENHIADYRYSATAGIDEKVTLLNEKVSAFTYTQDGKFTFHNVELKKSNVPAVNGLLHVIDGTCNYQCNVWEYLAQNPDLDSIRTFLYSYDEIRFDEDASIQGPIVNGAITYLDSVVRNSNIFFWMLGRLNDEDSSYTMFAPTNQVWRETLERTSTYYKYPASNNESVTYLRDSLANYYSKLAIVKNLAFSNNREVQPSPADSLKSTWYTTFRGDTLAMLYNNCEEPQEMSNGIVYVANSFNYFNTQWHDTIKIEAENTYYLPDENISACTTGTNRVTSTTKNPDVPGLVSRNAYLECTPLTAIGRPSVTFKIPSILSAAYRVKVVLVPANIASTSMLASSIMPNKIKATLKHQKPEGGTSLTTALNVTGLVNDPTKVDTLLLGEYKFPVCEYGFDNLSDIKTELNITVDLSSRDKDFDRTLRIDCIIFEPIESNELTAGE